MKIIISKNIIEIGFSIIQMLPHIKFISKRNIIILTTIVILLFVYYKKNQSDIDHYLREEIDHHLQEEIDFPIAFGLSVYRDPKQLQLLFSAIYQPFHVYCIHVDLKSSRKIHDLVRNLSIKFPNVILPKQSINVTHCEFSVLLSELLCMEALLKYKGVKWKYFINLTGQEWPLKVNLELVRILKALKGANLVEKIRLNPGRVPKNISVPHGIKLWKGAVHIIVIREFVKFALQDKRALDLLEYLKKTICPDETYFATLNNDHSLRAPGGYSGDFLSHTNNYPYLNRYKLWYTEHDCHGPFVHFICIFSMKEVPEMIDVNNMKLFANKFITDINLDVFNFMRSWLNKRKEIVYANKDLNPFINISFYSQLSVVKNHY